MPCQVVALAPSAPARVASPITMKRIALLWAILATISLAGAAGASASPLEAMPAEPATLDVEELQATKKLKCCDGTLSPSCVCGGPKRGCCSHHGGVCGCEE